MSTQAEIQEKIAAARREADMLKDKIRQRKDQTSDTSRKYGPDQRLLRSHRMTFRRRSWFNLLCSASHGSRSGTPTPSRHASPPYPQRSSRQDLRHALVCRQPTYRLGIAGRQAHCLGRLHYQQGTRHPAPIFLGHDLCLLTVRSIRCLRRFGQYMFHLLAQRR